MSTVASPFDPDDASQGDSYLPDLTAFDDQYAAAEPTKFSEVPDGKYQVRVQTARLDKSRKGDPLLKWDLVVVSGSCAGQHIFKYSVIRPTTLSFVKGDLECIGLRLTKFSDLAELLPGALDKTLEVRKKKRGDFTDVYFERLITLPAGVAPPPRPPTSEIPF